MLNYTLELKQIVDDRADGYLITVNTKPFEEPITNRRIWADIDMPIMTTL
jgi:hypothetical protein